MIIAIVPRTTFSVITDFKTAYNSMSKGGLPAWFLALIGSKSIISPVTTNVLFECEVPFVKNGMQQCREPGTNSTHHYNTLKGANEFDRGVDAHFHEKYSSPYFSWLNYWGICRIYQSVDIGFWLTRKHRCGLETDIHPYCEGEYMFSWYEIPIIIFFH